MSRVIDISLPIAPGLFGWPGDPPLELERVARLEDGDGANVSRIAASVHLGTHVDAPRHFLAEGAGAEALDLDALVGPALLLDVPGGPILGPAALAAALEEAGEEGCPERLLLRTENATRRARGEELFPDFCALSAEAAAWLAARGARLVGIDGPSVAPLADLEGPHRALLAAGVVIVEGLRLEQVPAGCYTLCCLPLPLVGADGAPARAVLLEAPDGAGRTGRRAGRRRDADIERA